MSDIALQINYVYNAAKVITSDGLSWRVFRCNYSMKYEAKIFILTLLLS